MLSKNNDTGILKEIKFDHIEQLLWNNSIWKIV